MYVDALLTLHGSISGNTVTGANAFATNANVNSTNVVDLASGGIPTATAQTRDIGGGNDMAKLRVEVTTAFSGGTSAEFQIITHDDTGQSTNVTVIGTTGAIPVASLTQGARFEAEINTRLLSKGQRYISMRTVNVGANAAGAIFADFGPDIEDFKTYQSGFAVL
ncbi:MAG TPA: hypothetical protein VFM48_05105 [Aquabacterium sp.]|nr:hypothetical protein [Aquabacterium sp.]